MFTLIGEIGESAMNVSDPVRCRWLSLVGCLSLSPMIAFATSDDGTITVGESVGGNLCIYVYSGSIGSYSPTGLTGGKTVADLFDAWAGSTCGLGSGYLFVSGFSSNPGQSWLTSVTCNEVARTGAMASSYSYASGTAEWNWVPEPFGFRFDVGEQLGCTIVHG